MTNLDFNENETNYINAPLNNAKHDVHIKQYLNKKCVNCNLPKGHYWITFNSSRDAESAYASLCVKSGIVLQRDHNFISFDLDETKQFSFVVSLGGGSGNIVKTLRKQALANIRNLGLDNNLSQNSLIQKQIKKHTDYGEEYNRDSFYDTIEECLVDEEPLIVDDTKSPADNDVRFLRYMRLEQLGLEIYKEEQELNKKREALEQQKNDLMKY